MKLSLSLSLLLAFTALTQAAPVPLFDGKSFDGWEGDTAKTWRIQDGAIIGGVLADKVPHNEFLATRRAFTDFDLRLKVKLVGTEGFVNGGVQFRSKRIPNHFEMIGYQADMGEGWWGSLYDESRRNKVLVKADPAVIAKALKKDDWNEYRVRAEGPHIQLWINGVLTVDYTESDPAIERSGQIALQVHGGGKTEASYKEIEIEELP